MTDGPDEVFDPSALRVNFTDKEAAAKAFEDLPVGEYNATIVDAVPTQCGPESKNPGKWYYRVEAVIDGGPYDNQHAWTNAMLFSPALYTISQIMKAIPKLAGRVPEGGGDVELPTREELVGEKVRLLIKRKAPQIGTGTKEEPQYPARNEWNGTKPLGGSVPASGAKAGKAGKGSLLPG
jgi:hypothetical protein